MLVYQIRVHVPADIASILEQAPHHYRRHFESESPECDAAVARIRSETGRFWAIPRQTLLPFAAEVVSGKLVLGAMSESPLHAQDLAPYLDAIGIEYTDCDIQEISCTAFLSLCRTSSMRSFVDDSRDLSEDSRLKCYNDARTYSNAGLRELILGEPRPTDELRLGAENLLSSSLADEIVRIMDVPNTTGAVGHPVHYIIQSEDPEFHREARLLLGEALYAAKRLQSQRLAIVNGCNSHVMEDLDPIYESAAGGTLCLNFTRAEDAEDRGRVTFRPVNYVENVEDAAARAQEHRENVLTIIHVPRKTDKLRELFQTEASAMAFVTIKEDTADYERAGQYLKMRAAAAGVEATDELLGKLRPGLSYSPLDLKRIFSEWRDENLRTVIYPQYAQAAQILSADELDPSGSAYEELGRMIGLTEAKAQIRHLLDYFTAQKIFRDRGITQQRPSMHMVFSGSPGTAKTTVARLVGRILKDNEVLESGHVIEAGRADLIGQFVGHTAPLVRRKFKQAMGGILFIDEAYSLLDDREGLYGDEALSTIVQEMENKRDSVMVIMAGYTDKMEHLLERNPGLRSRIAAHVPFEDYTEDELWEITQFHAEQMGIILAPGTKEKLLPIYGRVSGEPDFGNGRYVRNMLEAAVMKQSARLITLNPAEVTTEAAKTLIADDFEELRVGTSEKAHKIGFAS